MGGVRGRGQDVQVLALHGVLSSDLRSELLSHRALGLQGEAVCHLELGSELQASAFF